MWVHRRCSVMNGSPQAASAELAPSLLVDLLLMWSFKYVVIGNKHVTPGVTHDSHRRIDAQHYSDRKYSVP